MNHYYLFGQDSTAYVLLYVPDSYSNDTSLSANIENELSLSFWAGQHNVCTQTHTVMTHGFLQTYENELSLSFWAGQHNECTQTHTAMTHRFLRYVKMNVFGGEIAESYYSRSPTYVK
jgi:hypothetical protein